VQSDHSAPTVGPPNFCNSPFPHTLHINPRLQQWKINSVEKVVQKNCDNSLLKQRKSVIQGLWVVNVNDQ
jgi:hypothetical protein